MKRAALPMMAAAVVGASTLAHAASVLEFDVWMRLIDKRSVSVQRLIAAQDVEQASAQAQELERHYALMEAFFKQDVQAEDAARQSAEGRALAADISRALAQQDFESAAKSAVTLARTCNDCHDNHKPFNK